MRHDVRVADEVRSSARGAAKPQGDAPVAAQPFTHLGVPHAGHYRRLLRAFARAKERFIVHLRPEDIAAELRVDADDQLTEALDQLVRWGTCGPTSTPAASPRWRTFTVSGRCTSSRPKDMLPSRR